MVPLKTGEFILLWTKFQIERFLLLLTILHSGWFCYFQYYNNDANPTITFKNEQKCIPQ